jgi:hypothetical protein
MYNTLKNIHTASGAYVQTKGASTLHFQVMDRSADFLSEIPNVKWTPGVKVRLLNPGQLFKDGYNVLLMKEGATVIDPKNQTLMKVNECGNIYPFKLSTIAVSSSLCSYSTLSDNKLSKKLDESPLAMLVKMKTDLMWWHQTDTRIWAPFINW